MPTYGRGEGVKGRRGEVMKGKAMKEGSEEGRGEKG